MSEDQIDAGYVGDMLEKILSKVDGELEDYYDSPVVGKYQLMQPHEWTGYGFEFFDTIEEAIEVAKKKGFFDCVIAKADAFIKPRVVEYEVLQ